MKTKYENQNAHKIPTANGRRSLESRVCGMDIELAKKVLSGEIGINTAIKLSRYEYEYNAAQADQKFLFNLKPCKKDCTDGRGWSNPSEANLTRRGHQG